MACCPKDAGPGETIVKLLASLLVVVPALAAALVLLPFVLLFLAFGGRVDLQAVLAWPSRMAQAAAESVTAQRCRLSGRCYPFSPRLAGLVYRHFLLAAFALAALAVAGTTRLAVLVLAGTP